MMIRAIGLLVAVCAFAVLLLAGPIDATELKLKVDMSAKPTFDGLYPVDTRDPSRRLWVKPGADLSRYTKIMPREEGIELRALKPNESRDGPMFPISEKNQQSLEEMLREIFHKELAKSTRYKLTDKPGPDVLWIRDALIDVASFIPPDSVSGRVVVLRSIGQATLVLELRDSETHEIFARAADSQAGRGMAITMRADARSEVRRILTDWAVLLRKRLDEITTL